MRYSVVLPRIEATDGEGARRALDQAQDLWTQGEQRAALDQVRLAAESAGAAGQKERALALGRAVSMLARAIGASSVRPPVISDAPAVSSPRVRVSTAGVPSAVTEPPPHTQKPHSLMRPTVPAPGSVGLLATEPAMGAVSARPPAPQVPPIPVVSAPAPRITPIAMPAPAAVPPASVVAVPVAVEEMDVTDAAIAEPAEDADLVVTIAPDGWGLASPSALVGHRAERVAIAPGRGPGGTLMVRPLRPGEVAPKGSVVAVMVSLEPGGALPLSRTG